MLKKLGLIAIGESPRTDYVPIIRNIIGRSVEIREKGLLDGMSSDEIFALAPCEGEHPVISRLSNGETAVLSKKKLSNVINRKLFEFKEEGFNLIVLMCTGLFEGIVAPEGVYLLLGSDIIANCVRAAVPAHSHLGIIVPLSSQENSTAARFKALGYHVTMSHGNPYGKMSETEKAAESLSDCDVIVLHCMAYTREHRSKAMLTSGVPVLEANAFIGHVCAELLAE